MNNKIASKWPFFDPPNVAVFTSVRVLEGIEWVHYVTHDRDDEAWQFHPASGPTPEKEAVVVGLAEMISLDPRIAELADLPVGWHAWRESKEGLWMRRETVR